AAAQLRDKVINPFFRADITDTSFDRSGMPKACNQFGGTFDNSLFARTDKDLGAPRDECRLDHETDSRSASCHKGGFAS
ncbi:hypothetical protein Q4578_20725, partial [Shimia thalassica]|uniref:hypothetical protein n=1 Tax=Shimia thalassica TaxID=1715693 RepID=UPI0026E1EDC0